MTVTDSCIESAPEFFQIPEGYTQPNRRIGMIVPTKARLYFLGPERTETTDRIITKFDDTMDGSSKELVRLAMGKVVELKTYTNQYEDIVRSLIIHRLNSNDEVQRARAFSIIETPEFGFFGEYHAFETEQRSTTFSHEHTPHRLNRPALQLFEMLDGAHLLTLALSVPTRDLLSV